MHIALEPKQTLAFTTPATEVLFGGAAGGGKSYLLRVSAMRWCMEVGGIQVYLFRRTLPDLRDNHLRGPTSFHVMLREHLESGHVKYRSVENEFEFWNGSILHLCYCDSENDVEKYRGAEIHVLLIDELTHFTEYQYRFLRSRVRRAGLEVPDQYKKRIPRIEAASNPGSIGHAWVKRTFISSGEEMKPWRVRADEGGMLRQFIPARLSDNPHLTKDDPEYADRLRGLGTDNLVRAMLEGDWDIIAGAAFEKLRRETHSIEPFEPPEDWMCFGSFDWGSTRPFSFGLWTVANGNALPDGRLYRRGAIIRYNEVYGWNGKPNEGLRKEADDVASMLKSRIGHRRLGYIAADPSMWKVDGSPSIAENMLREGVVLRKADNARLVGYVQVRQRISGDEDGPMLYATKNCVDGFWRTMPDLVMDERHVEDVDCWVAGTMISTPNGNTPIEQVMVGDLVNTPIGPRRVLKSYVSGPSRTIRVSLDNGTELRGTPHHKVYVDGVGLVPLRGLTSDDILIKRNTAWNELLLFTRVSISEKATLAVDTLMHAFRYIVLCGLNTSALFLKATTFTTKTMTDSTIGSKISNAFLLPITPDTITAGATTCEKSRWHGEHQEKAKKSLEKIFERPEPIRRYENWRASIVEILLKRDTQQRNPVPKNVTKRITGLLKSVLSAEIDSKRKSTKPEKYKPARIVAVGICEEKTPVYNLTINQAHLFYANGVLSSNTDQEDHCYDDVRYACQSRPWISVVKKNEQARVKDWFREKETVDGWRTV